MSAFDDEFGLFGDEAGEEEERKSTLGARKIASNETIIDEIEPEDEPSPRRFRGRGGPPGERREGGGFPGRRQHERAPRAPLADEIAIPRAVELLTFLAQKLVSKPEAVRVSVQRDDKGTVLELVVSADDIGKVIGRAGRVAQALRTIVRAGAEGRVTVDIVDVDHVGDAATSPELGSDAAPSGSRGRRTRGPRPFEDRSATGAGAARSGAAVESAVTPEPDDDDDVADDEIAVSPVKKSGVKKPAVKKAGAKKATASKATAAKKATSVKKATSAKTASVAKKAPADKKAPAAKKSLGAKKAPAKKAAVAKVTAKKATAKKAVAKASAVKKTAARKKKS